MKTIFKKRILNKWDKATLYSASILFEGKQYFTNIEVSAYRDNIGLLKRFECSLIGYFETYSMTEGWQKIHKALYEKYI